VQLFNWKSF